MDNSLQHHGIKGQKWGVRRFQKKDGSLTPEGKKRYDDAPASPAKKEGTDVVKKKRSKGMRVAAVLLRTTLVDTAVSQVSAHLLLSGQEGAAKALGTIGAMYSWGTMARDLYKIAKDD